MTRPFAWEASYPPGLAWDTPLEIQTLTAMLDNAVRRYGDKNIIEFRERQISFKELGRRVDRVAAGLQHLGVKPGDAVALYLPNVPYHPIAFFGILRAGARVVHLSPLDPTRALARKLADSGARVLVSADFPTMLPQAAQLLVDGLLDHLVVGQDAAWGPGPPTLPLPDDPRAIAFGAMETDPGARAWPKLDVEDIAVLQYTGGTTGLPRAAMLSHANLSAACSSYDIWHHGVGRGWQETDRVIGVLPLFHIYMLTTVLLRSIQSGIEILLRLRFDPATTLDDIEKKRATVFPGVPTMFIALAAFPGIDGRDLSSLRVASSGGAPLPIEVAHRFEELTRHRVGGGWGMTETSPAGTTMLPNQLVKPGAIGLPLPGIEMDIVALDDPSHILPTGETGQIRIRGANVTKGYWKRPEESANAFVDGFFLTGDVGYMDEAGQFYIVDRLKDLILSGGFNVYPRLIEDAIYEHPDVEECTVVGIPDAYRGQAAKAFVKLRGTAEPFTIEALKAFLADKLGRHEIPAAVEFRDALPRTAVGKLSRRELAEEEAARAIIHSQPAIG
jgi:long-chain acyl-CoA synthetase